MTRLVHTCGVTSVCVTWLVYLSEMTQICVIWLIRMCDVTRISVKWRAPYIRQRALYVRKKALYMQQKSPAYSPKIRCITVDVYLVASDFVYHIRPGLLRIHMALLKI